jgi:hypothetical protein
MKFASRLIPLAAAVLLAIPGRASVIGLENNWDVELPQIAGGTGLVFQTSPLSSTENTTENQGGSFSSATQTDTSFYGSLSASGSGTATNSPSFGSWTDAGNPVGDVYPYDTVAEYIDSIHITSSTLPLNTPVTMMITEDFVGAASGTTNGNGSTTGWWDAYIYGGLQATDAGPVAFNFTLFSSGQQTEIVDTFVGDTIQLQGDIYAYGRGYENWGGDNTSTFQYSGQSTTLLDVLTTGASYSAASGTVYGTELSTPEPGTWTLMPVSLALAGVLSRRRTRAAAMRNPVSP